MIRPYAKPSVRESPAVTCLPRWLPFSPLWLLRSAECRAYGLAGERGVVAMKMGLSSR